MHRYRYGGDVLHSSLPLPELAGRPAAEADAPVWTCRPGAVADPPAGRPLHTWLDESGGRWLTMTRARSGFTLAFAIGIRFQVEPAEIRWQADTGCSPATVRHLLLDQVLPLANSWRGVFGLHGAAVALAGRAVAFVGRSGQGKSTLAAAMAGQGAALVADDYAVLQRHETGWQVVPSYPGARLWDDARAWVGGGQAWPSSPLADYTSKRRVQVPASADAVPLARIYLLESVPPDVAPAIAPARAHEAVQLLRFVFAMDIEDRQALTRDLDRAAALVEGGFVRRLRAPRAFAALADVRAAIAAEMLDG